MLPFSARISRKKARFHILRTSGLAFRVAHRAVLCQVEGEVDDLLRLLQPLSVGGELSFGLSYLGVDPGLLALERLHVDGVEVVGAKELVALVGELLAEVD